MNAFATTRVAVAVLFFVVAPIRAASAQPASYVQRTVPVEGLPPQVQAACADALAPLAVTPYYIEYQEFRSFFPFESATRTLYAYDPACRFSETLSQRETGDTWQNAHRSLYTYEQEGSTGRTIRVDQDWQGADWVNITRTTTTYDVADPDAPTEALTQNWNADEAEWVNSLRILYEYDAGQIASQTYQSWNRDLEQWENGNRTLYTYTSDQTTTTEQAWNGSDWMNLVRTIETYDGSGNLISEVEENWNGSDWETTVQTLYTYDAGTLSLEERFQRNFFPPFDLILYERTTYTYDGSTETAVTESRDFLSDELVNNTRTTTYYNASDQIEHIVEETWDSDEEEWVLESQTLYSYDGAGNLSQLTFQMWDGSDWETVYEVTMSWVPDCPQVIVIPLPVELVEFTARLSDGAVQLAWRTLSETNNAGFEIERRREDGAWDNVGFVEGRGTTLEPQQYTFRASDPGPGRHLFRLRQIDFDGQFSYSPEVAVDVELPEAYALSAAYPNPFNPQARFTLAVQAPQHAEVTVYDLLGQRVAILHHGALEAHRTYTFTIDGRGLASGVYFYEVAAEHFREVRSITLVK